MLYADDAVIFSNSLHDLSVMIGIADELLSMYGMHISIKKTKVMIYNQLKSTCKVNEEEGSTTNNTITIRGEEIEVVEEFKYLGTIISSRVGGKEDRGGIWAEVEARKKAASKAFGMLRRSIFKNKHISINNKILIYKITVLPTLLYASETWTISNTQINELNSFHMKCLRAICNISLLDKHKNTFILNKTKTENITDLISRYRWDFFGRIMACDIESSLTKRVMCGKVKGGRRRVGKAPLRWSDLVAKHGRDLLEKDGVETTGFDHAWLTFHTSAIKSYHTKKKNRSSM